MLIIIPKKNSVLKKIIALLLECQECKKSYKIIQDLTYTDDSKYLKCPHCKSEDFKIKLEA